jgi:phytoene dehydrogenase-like protein
MVRRSAIVVGSGPNGLAAAIELARSGFEVEVREAAAVPGGGARSVEWTLPGFIHDCCSAVHPFAIGSPYFSKLNLQKFGLRWIWSEAEAAHPMDDGTAVMLWRDLDRMKDSLGTDVRAWTTWFAPLAAGWNDLARDVFSPLGVPRNPFLLARFGLKAILPVTTTAPTFRGQRARALFGGMGAHSIKRLDRPLSSAIGIMLIAAGHANGWPVPEGGAHSISDALIRVLESYGGRVVTSSRVNHLREVKDADLVMLDITPRQLLELGSDLLPGGFKRQLRNYRYGPGVFKVDWALREPIPWRAKECAQSITVHLGGTLEEMAESEMDAWEGRPPKKPFVLLAQHTLFDRTRAPEGQHTAWAYCHVPTGWTGSALEQIENQVERFAPGFRECVLARSVHGPAQLETMNENLVEGDINGGPFTVKQFVLRPTWREYGTPLKNVYLCSSSTLPGGGVHGMCGYNAARVALRRFTA